MSARATRLRDGIEQMQSLMAETAAEAKMVRKIAHDLLDRATKLAETAAYQDRQIADWQAMLRDEEERA